MPHAHRPHFEQLKRAVDAAHAASVSTVLFTSSSGLGARTRPGDARHRRSPEPERSREEVESLAYAITTVLWTGLHGDPTEE